MKGFAKSNVETKKTWVTPELKKVDIEQITAHNRSTGGDGGGLRFSLS
jgi:hypothetical protein